MSRLSVVAGWKLETEPYCITRLSRAKGNYVPIRKGGKVRRFASVQDASAECERIAKRPSHDGHLLFVDFASAYEKSA